MSHQLYFSWASTLSLPERKTVAVRNRHEFAALAPLNFPHGGAEPGNAAGLYNYLKALAGLISLRKISEADVLDYLRSTLRCDQSFVSLAEKKRSAIAWLHDNWSLVDQEIARVKKEGGPVPAMRWRTAYAVDAIRRKIKQMITESSSAVPGYGLRPGRVTEVIVDPQQVWHRFSQKLGGTLDGYMKCIKVVKAPLK